METVSCIFGIMGRCDGLEMIRDVTRTFIFSFHEWVDNKMGTLPSTGRHG